MKKKLILLAGLIAAAILLAGGSSKTYKDGEYKGRSGPDKRGSYGIVNIIINGGKITKVDYKEYQNDGTVKNENYQKGADEMIYVLAQKAVKGTSGYGQKLIEVQDVDLVDAVAGATNSNKHFKAAVTKALE